ncbi:MAG: helix-turn-helix domain-containing protein [Ruminococcus sp.]|nr:helix-turn-helix domain-containing protein [Ruminococcus sp.]
MYEEQFPIRLAKLRMEKGVSARDMSLSIGQNAGYINNIENGKALPSMAGFFFICEYLNITPQEFFDIDSEQPEFLDYVIENLKKLNRRQLQNISAIIEDLVEK